MARIPYIEEKDLAPEDKKLLQRGLNLYRTLAYSPGAANAFQNFSYFLRYHSTLNPRLRELAILQVGYLTKAAYSFYGHIGYVSAKFGVTDEDVKGVLLETQGKKSSLDLLTRTVLKGAREMTMNVAMAEDTFAELRKQMSNRELVDLVSTIAFYNAAVRYMRTMDIEIEADRMDSYKKYKSEFPLPPGN